MYTLLPSSWPRTALFSVVALAALMVTSALIAGCDQSPMNDDGDNVITANSQRISFEVTPGTPDTTQQLTLTYTSLGSRPRPEEVPAPFSISVAEDTGSPDNGTSVFDVTFSPSDEINTFVEPIRFNADGRTVTVQLFGNVGFDDTLITDYLGGGVVDAEVGPAADPLPPIFFFNGIAGANIVDGELNVEGAETGGPNAFPGLAHLMNEVVDFTETQVVVARMKVSEDSPGPAFVRLALNTVDGPDANASIEPLVKEVPADGEYREYYFDFRDNFVQFDGQPADPSIVSEAVLLVNDGGSLGFLGRSDTFTGTLSIARLARRGDIPGEEDDGGGNENTPPSATFSFEPGSPLVGESITFTDNSTDDGMIASREWDFGDGTTASGAEASHTYSETGDYTVTLTVTDDEGATATASQTVTVMSDDDTGGTSDFRGDEDGDGRIIFDDFEDGIEDGEYFSFAGGGAGIGLAETEDVPMESSGTTALEATIEGGSGGGFAGYGKGTGSEIEVQGLDLSDLGNDPYLTMYIRSNATVPYTLEINLQEDQDGNGTFDGSGPVDDEFQYDYAVSPDASGYTRISVPISAFVDDNAVNNGGDGELSNRIANLIFAIGNMPGETFTFTVDDIIYSDTDLGSDETVQSACGDDYELFFEDNFDAPNEEFWDRGNATFNGNLAYFRPENITYEDGKMILNLREEQYQGRPYTGAELRTDNQDGFYGYGCYEVRMKSAGPSGTVSSFFGYRYNPWQEIDIEVVGKNNNSMLTNIYFNEGPEGEPNNDAYQVPPFPEGVGLSYDASEEFHNYAFEWLPGEIKWYRDGQLVKQATVEGASPDEIPDIDMQIMMNLWVSDSPSFAGEIDDSNFPVRSEYDWVRFYRPVE